jgi:hypothetical protein
MTYSGRFEHCRVMSSNLKVFYVERLSSLCCTCFDFHDILLRIKIKIYQRHLFFSQLILISSKNPRHHCNFLFKNGFCVSIFWLFVSLQPLILSLSPLQKYLAVNGKEIEFSFFIRSFLPLSSVHPTRLNLNSSMSRHINVFNRTTSETGSTFYHTWL